MHSTFNPSTMFPDQLEATFVERGNTVSRIVDLFINDSKQQSRHNILIVGPRGIGKSHTVAVIRNRLISHKDINKALAIAYLREDEWGLTTLADLFLRIYEALIGERNSDSASALRLSSYDKSSSELEKDIWHLILGLLNKRSLLVIIENLDTILAGIGIDAQQRLRALIQTVPVFSFLATSTTISSDISDQRHPFYGFFEIVRLEGLTLTNAVSLLRRVALSRGDIEMDAFIAGPIGRARIRAVQHLAGGNSRVFILFYDVLKTRGPSPLIDDHVLEPLQRMIDYLTPYYQSKMERLSPLQQKIILYLCQRRVPATVTKISQNIFSSNQTTASQLRQLLDTRYVRVNRLGRESYYELSEPLMRICIETKSHESGPLRLLVEFLRYWFYREELEKQLSSLEESGETQEYIRAALKEYDSTEGHHHLNSDIERLCRDLDAASDKEGELAEELATVSKIAQDWGHYIRALLILERPVEAIPHIEKALRVHPESVPALIALGRAYSATNRQEDALAMYARAIEISPKDGQAWYFQGQAFTRLSKYDDALKSYDAASKLSPYMAPQVRIDKASTLANAERYEEALKTLQPVMKNAERHFGAYGIYGWSLYLLGRYKEAHEYLEKATKYFPDDQIALTYLALCTKKLKKPTSAIEMLSRAYHMHTDNKWTASKYCKELVASGQYDKALSELPNEIVAHQILHLFLDLLNRHLKQGVLYNEIKTIEMMSSDPRWSQAFGGALVEILGFVSKAEDTPEITRDIEIWHRASVELFEGQDRYSMYLDVMNVLVQHKKGAGLGVLLTLPLEQRRLIVSEEEEQALGKV